MMHFVEGNVNISVINSQFFTDFGKTLSIFSIVQQKRLFLVR
jgi:hypothetical protein